jgi:hypothetical protein
MNPIALFSSLACWLPFTAPATLPLVDQVEIHVRENDSYPAQEAILSLIEELRASQHVSQIGNDDARVPFVTLQAEIEGFLTDLYKDGLIRDLVGIIHTPTPATPVCTDLQNIEQAMDPLIRSDQQKQNTVRSRVSIIRDYLEAEAPLYVVYPAKGLNLRSEQQQEIYKNNLLNYPNALHDVPLEQEKFDSPLRVGATYLFCGSKGELCSFSIRASQANAPAVDTDWALWFGPVSSPVIAERIEEISTFLEENHADVPAFTELLKRDQRI